MKIGLVWYELVDAILGVPRYWFSGGCSIYPVGHFGTNELKESVGKVNKPVQESLTRGKSNHLHHPESRSAISLELVHLCDPLHEVDVSAARVSAILLSLFEELVYEHSACMVCGSVQMHHSCSRLGTPYDHQKCPLVWYRQSSQGLLDKEHMQQMYDVRIGCFSRKAGDMPDFN